MSSVVSSSATPLSARRPSFAERTILAALRGMPHGRLQLDLPDCTHVFGDRSAILAGVAPGVSNYAFVRVRRPDAFFKKCLLHGDIGFAESYIDGDWDSPDLTAVVGWFVLNHENAPTLSGSRRAQSLALNLLRAADRLGHLLRPNNRTIARRNIAEHYDLSNDFFALWLDETMMYSAAKWERADATLHEAQVAKNDALCRQLRLKPDDHVLEIGTGWGGWSLHAATKYGCRVTTVTISQQQHDLAVKRIAAACARLLKPDGLLALQFITVPDHRYEALRTGVDFIQKHIFPGSLLLSVNRLNGLLAEKGGLVLHAFDDFGRDYAKTLRIWRDSFHAKLDRVRALGFDERFIRKWRYYLCYCEAAFAMRHISVVHTLHTRANNLSL